jgi:kumamolisin
MISFGRIPKTIAIVLLGFMVSAGVTSSSGFQNSRSATRRLEGHMPGHGLRGANWLGRERPDTSIALSIALPLRNQSELENLLLRISNPSDPLYGNYLTTEEFINRFCPTQEDYDQVQAYARNMGFSIKGTHSNRLLLDVAGSAQVVENSFNLRMHRYRAQDGRDFHAPDNNPEVPDSIASRIVGVIGLDNAVVWHPHSFSTPIQERSFDPLQIGTGPGSALSPDDISKAYNLSTIASKGSGQVLGLFELDGYNESDIAAYEKYFNLPAVPLKNVLVGGASGKAGSGADEVTLDIELMAAMTPNASQIIVYEGPNTSSGVLSTYNRIATDNLAKQISTSWGAAETLSSNAFLISENAIFAQMAAQGQTIFAAAGDSGAYDNGSTLSVDDPASQPFVVGVGGTRLYVNSNGTYNRETTWNSGSVRNGAGGGGISSIWGIPAYQQGVASTASTIMRNVPDVALNGDPNSGYSIFYNGQWYIFGGTSCAAPLWAGFTAIVNQERTRNSSTTLGFANPAIYQIGTGSGFGLNFFDISDGSTNLYYPAATGYDNATGWGSLNGAGLMSSLVAMAPTIPAPSAPQNLKATAGSAAVTLTWTSSALATQYTVYRGLISSTSGLSAIATVSANSYTDTNLTNNTTYYYAVKASNNAGTSAFSTVVSAQPAPPSLAITAGPYASITRTSATISWTTNLASSSAVYFGTSSRNLNQSISTSSLSTSHTLLLSPLSPGTTYYIQIRSSAGSTTVKSSTYYFVTPK